MQVEQIFEKHKIKLQTVLQIGIEYSNMAEAKLYKKFKANRVLYVDMLPSKILHAEHYLQGYKKQSATRSSIMMTQGKQVKIFCGDIAFKTTSQTIDSLLVHNHLHPLSINYVSIMIDGPDAKVVVESMDVLLRCGIVRNLYCKNTDCEDKLNEYGFYQVYDKFFMR